MKAYQAYASGGFCKTADSPRRAAEDFFAKFPNKRKCSIIEGETDGHFFTVALALRGSPTPSWHDVTRKTLSQLPEETI